MNGTRALDSNTDSKIVYNGNKERHSFLQENISQIYASARLIEKSMLLDETFLDDYPPESRAKLSTSEFTNDKFETENIKIPSNIAAKITDNKINSVCGLAPFFPLAWFACDEKFVLWSFTERKPFQVLTEVEGLIRAAEIVESPNKSETVQMVIFLATETEIVILEGNKTSVQHFARQKSLKPKKIEISVPTNGEKFDKITVSKRGQVFLKSQNGQLFELEYKDNRSRFPNIFGDRRKLRKIETRSSLQKLFVPLKQIFGKEAEGIVSTAVDDSRDLLFAATATSICCWQLTGDTIQFVSSILKVDLKHEKIVSVFPVSALDCVSQRCFGFGLTNKNSRIFFSVS